MSLFACFLVVACSGTSSLTGPEDDSSTGSASVSSVEVTPSNVDVAVGGTASLTLEATTEDGQPADGDGQWTVSDTSMVVVEGNGKERRVTGRKQGSTEVIATVDGVSDTATVDVAPEVPSGGLVFEDDFDSGSLAADQNGYGWGNYVRNKDPDTGEVRSGVFDGIGRNGTPGFRFFFPGVADGEDVTSKINYHVAPLQEAWIEYWLHIPENYKHRDQDGATNNKFFGLWGGSRKDLEVGVLHNLFHTGHLNGGGPNELFLICYDNDLDGGGNRGNLRTKVDAIPPEVHGTWVQYRHHIAVGTPEIEQDFDGVYEFWINGDLKVARSDLWIRAKGGNPNELTEGQIFGWSNSGFDENTSIVMDDFKIYTSDPGW